MRDELMKHFAAPTGFSSGDPAMETTGAPSVPRAIGLPSELPSLYAGEYAAPASSLPTQVSQATILAQNEGRGDNMWPGNRGPLAGTTVEEGDNE